MIPSTHAFVTLARILRPRGNKGEIVAEILTDFPERLTKLREVYLWDGRGARRAAAVRNCWLHGDRAVFHFEGQDSIAAAEKLRGLEVQVPLAERVQLPAGKYYVTDLAGCEVFAADGLLVGTVEEVQFTGEKQAGTPLLVVRTPRGEVLIPFAEEICRKIDTAGRRIEVQLPEGLRELNRE